MITVIIVIVNPSNFMFNFSGNTSCVGTCYPYHKLEDLMNAEEPSGSVRLVNGSKSLEGFIQIKKNNEWGVVCYANAFVSNLVCQELGYQGGTFVRFDDGELKRIEFFSLSPLPLCPTKVVPG